MIWAKAALVGGLLVLVATFAIGTENQLSASVMGPAQGCGPSISASWLVPGTPDQATQGGSSATNEEQRASEACGPVIRKARVLIVTIMAIGGLLALVGWTAIRTRREDVPRTVAPVHS